MANDSGQVGGMDSRTKLTEAIRNIGWKIASEESSLIKLENASTNYPQASHKQREGNIEYITNQIHFVRLSAINFSQWAKEASDYAEITAKNPELVDKYFKRMGKLYFKLAVSSTFLDEKTSLEEWMDGLIPEDRNSVIAKLGSFFATPAEPTVIPIAYPDLPNLERLEDSYQLSEKFMDANFWSRVAQVCQAEQSMRSLALDKLEAKILSIGLTDFKETLLPGDSYKEQIEKEKEYIANLKAQKAELEELLGTSGSLPPKEEEKTPEQVVADVGDDFTRAQTLINKYTLLIIAKNPGMSEAEARLQATQLTGRIMVRRKQLVLQWIKALQSRNSQIDLETARAQAEKIVDLQLTKDEEALFSQELSNLSTVEMNRQNVQSEVQRQTPPQPHEEVIVTNESFTWRDYLRSPNLIFRQVGGWLNKYLSRKPSEHILETARSTTERVVGVVTPDWRTNLKVFWGNPIGSIVNFFRSAKKVTETAKAGATMIKTAATVTTGVTTIAEGGAVATGTVAGGVPGLVIAAIIAGKKILDQVKRLIPKEIREMLSNAWSKIKIGLGGVALWFLLNPGAAIGGLIGGLFGGALAPILGPLAPFAPAFGFAAGSMVGYAVQGVFSSILGFGGGGGMVGTLPAGAGTLAGVGLSGVLGGLGSSASALIGGTSVSALSIWIGTGIGSVFLLSLGTLLTIVNAQERQEQGSIGLTTDAVFTLEKQAITSEFPDYDGSLINVQYKLLVKTGSNPITINSVTDELTLSTDSNWSDIKDIDISNISVEANYAKEIPYQIEISGEEFKDSELYNSVTVTATDSKNKKETLKASTTVKLGTPIEDKNQPFGYPASGYITSLDLDSAGNTHTSYFFNLGQWVHGGLDIAAIGDNIPVYATMDGNVVLADWKRSSTANADVGGVVYIENGPYIVEYMHLDESVKSLQGKRVKRGDIIGRTYPGKLGAIYSSSGGTGQHVHYQVLFNGGNVFFGDENNSGSCAAGKILPYLPGLLQQVTATTATSCQ